MPLEADLYVPSPLDLIEVVVVVVAPVNDLDEDERVDPLTVFRRISADSWPTVLLSGELSAL